MGLKVDVTVQGKQVRVLGNHLLALHRDWEFHETVPKQVVHVHHLQTGEPCVMDTRTRISQHTQLRFGPYGLLQIDGYRGSRFFKIFQFIFGAFTVSFRKYPNNSLFLNTYRTVSTIIIIVMYVS